VLKFFELPPSPNNAKIRMALRFKGIEFEAEDVDRADRSRLVEVSGQELSPVIQDKGVVVNDSDAILQFLDANYPGPRLFPAERAGRKACDAWFEELNPRVRTPVGALFMFTIGMIPDPGEPARQGLRAGLAWLEEQVGEDGTLCGADKPACDLLAATWAVYALPGEGFKKRVPLVAKVEQVMGIARGTYPKLEKLLEPWNQRLA